MPTTRHAGFFTFVSSRPLREVSENSCALAAAIQTQNRAVITALLKAGADVNWRSDVRVRWGLSRVKCTSKRFMVSMDLCWSAQLGQKMRLRCKSC